MKKTLEIALSDTIIQKTNTIISTYFGNELIIMDKENGSYLNMNVLGTKIWDFIKEPIRVEILIAQLLVKFNVDEQTCKTEVYAFLNQLNDLKLITIQA